MLLTGVNCHFYLNTGTFGSPTWTLVSNVEDVDLGFEMSMAKVKSRSMLLVGHLPAMLESPLTFGILAETGLTPPVAPSGSVNGTFLGTLRAAFFAQSREQFAVADGPIATTGSVYFTLEYYISKVPLAQKLEEHEDCQVECQPAYSVNNVAACVAGLGFSVAA